MKKCFGVIVMSCLLFSTLAMAQQGTFVAPTGDGELGIGQWSSFDWGQYTVARDNNTVLIISTWDPLVEKPADIYNWRQDQGKKAPASAAKLAIKLMDTPGIVNVIIAKHRLEVYRANIYTWEMLLPKVVKAFETSEVQKGQ